MRRAWRRQRVDRFCQVLCALGCQLTCACAGDDVAPDAGRTAPNAATSNTVWMARGGWHQKPPPPMAAGSDERRTRGEYLVRHVGGCMECHTPRLPSGAFDESRLLSGVEDLVDLEPDDPERGLLHSRNLTPDEKTGIGKFSDEQLKKAFQQGIDDESTVLHWMMPYWIYRNLTPADADAIVAFLRSIPKVVHDVPDSQPNAVELAKPYEPYRLAVDALPQVQLEPDTEGYESAERGRYLATSASPCLLCHTPVAKDPSRPIDPSLAFTGRRQFLPVRMGMAQGLDEGVPLIESFNLTPHANGLGGWTPRDVANVLLRGVGRDSLPTCDPMPASFGGSFSGMTETDAMDLGRYFLALPPKDTGMIARCCTACHKGPSGFEDAGTDDDAGR